MADSVSNDVRHIQSEERKILPYKRVMKSKIPVLSKSYTSVLKDIRGKKEEIERKWAELRVLRSDLEKTTHRDRVSGDTVTVERQTVAVGKQIGRGQGISPYTKSEIKTVIVTPKGTKRTVRKSHVRFEKKLDDVLKANVTEKKGESLAVEELLSRLYSYDFLKTFERKELLKEVSLRVKKRVKYRGKGESRKPYYDDLSMTSIIAVPSPDKATDNFTYESEFASPKRKQRKGSSGAGIPACKTQLHYQDATGYSPSVDQLAKELENIDVSNDVSVLEEGGTITAGDGEIRYLQSKIVNLSANNEQLSSSLVELQTTFDEYVQMASNIMTKQNAIIDLYKEIVKGGQMLGGLLSVSERDTIKNEIGLVKDIFHLGLRDKSKDLASIIDPFLFEDILGKLQTSCPTIVSILEELVLSRNASRNTVKTPSMKMKAAVHLLASLIDVRDQNATNDIPILFGLLCLCFGAGPSLIGLLQRLGLSECHPVLIGVLKGQMSSYQALIETRVGENNPVVTFQDNMQLRRTSLRHLRLSKLQQEKARQNKIWDFTVRGWRVADITGMENQFQSNLPMESQRKVKDLKYEDTCIDNNPDHEAKWKKFQERNTLRKMDIALNSVACSKEDLESMSNTDVQSIAEVSTEKRRFKIVVPSVPSEFPDMAQKEAKAYRCQYLMETNARH